MTSTNPFLALLPEKAPAPSSTWLWATVTSTSPLQVQIDTEDDPLDGTPSTLVDVSVGDRVYVVVTRRHATIIGIAGGSAPPLPETVFDSGVVTLKPASPWDGAAAEGVHIARSGPMVSFSAIVASSAATSGKTVILKIPAGFRPAFTHYPATYADTANVSIESGGNFNCWTSVASGTTVRVSASWYSDDDEPN